eukprot:UN12649
MSTELGIQASDNVNSVNSVNPILTTTDHQMHDIMNKAAVSHTNEKLPLDTPSRDSNATNNVGIGGATAATPLSTNINNHTMANGQYEKLPISKPKHLKNSSMTSDENPLTIAREKKLKEGESLMVNFDERVVVHTVPYWDPCGETFYDTDDDDGPRGPNCCIIL